MVRLFRPGLLSMIGTSGPFALAWLFLTTPTSTHSGGSESALAAALGLFFALVIGAWGLLLLAFAIVLFVDPAHSRIWGAIVAFFYAIGYIPLLILYGSAFSPDLGTAIIGITGTIAYVLGFVGGVWGLFSRSSWIPFKAGKAVVGPSARIFFGGLISFVATAIIGGYYSVIPLLLVLGPLWLSVRSRYRRTVGFILLGISLAYALLWILVFASRLITFHGLGGYEDQVPNLIAVMVGSVLAGWGAVSIIRRKQTEAHKTSLNSVLMWCS